MAKTTLEERHQKLHASMEMLEAKLEESDATYNSTSTNLMDEIKEVKRSDLDPWSCYGCFIPAALDEICAARPDRLSKKSLNRTA